MSTGNSGRLRNLLLIAAFISFALSIYLWFSGQKEQGLYVGLWVPSIISLGTLMSAGNSGRARNLVLMAALISFALSIYLWFSGQKEQGLYVGLWVPSIIALGTLLIPNSGKAL